MLAVEMREKPLAIGLVAGQTGLLHLAETADHRQSVALLRRLFHGERGLMGLLVATFELSDLRAALEEAKDIIKYTYEKVSPLNPYQEKLFQFYSNYYYHQDLYPKDESI